MHVLADSSFANNTVSGIVPQVRSRCAAPEPGGSISGASLSMLTRLPRCHAPAQGGAVAVFNGSLSVLNCTFSQNVVLTSEGGGTVFVVIKLGDLAAGAGGALYAWNSYVSIAASTARARARQRALPLVRCPQGAPGSEAPRAPARDAACPRCAQVLANAATLGAGVYASGAATQLVASGTQFSNNSAADKGAHIPLHSGAWRHAWRRHPSLNGAPPAARRRRRAVGARHRCSERLGVLVRLQQGVHGRVSAPLRCGACAARAGADGTAPASGSLTCHGFRACTGGAASLWGVFPAAFLNSSATANSAVYGGVFALNQTGASSSQTRPAALQLSNFSATNNRASTAAGALPLPACPLSDATCALVQRPEPPLGLAPQACCSRPAALSSRPACWAAAPGARWQATWRHTMAARSRPR